MIILKSLKIKCQFCDLITAQKYTFYRMNQLARKYSITVAWFYGEPGHGKGLVDAMSSFGCKKPLHHSIISEDVWYPKAFDMVNFLKSYFQSDDSKEYFLGKNTDILKPCRKFQLIAVSNEGQFHRELYLHDLEIPSKMFNENSPIERRLDEGDEVNEYEDVSEPTEHHLHQNAVFEIIKPGTFI